MTSIGVAELKASLSEYLARVKAGEEVLITERGQPIARIVPLVGVASYGARIARLVSKGRLRLPEEAMDVESFLALPLPEDPRGAVLAALLAEREEGR
jgi:prevent-host-death family protein